MNQFRLFLKSFRFSKLFWIISALEYGLWAAAVLLFWIVGTVLDKLSFPDLVDFTAPESVLASNAAALESALGTMFLVVTLLLVLLLFNFSFFRGMIWLRILKKKFSVKTFFKFSLLNLVWLIIFGVVTLVYLLIAALLVRDALGFLTMYFGIIGASLIMLPLYILVLSPLLFYIINSNHILHINFFTEKHFIRKAWETVLEFRKLILPSVFIGIVGMVLFFVYSFVPIFGSEGYGSILLSLILVALFCSWYKLYLVKVLDG